MAAKAKAKTPLLKRGEYKELIVMLNTFMGWTDAESKERIRVKTQDDPVRLKSKLDEALKALYESSFNGEGFTDVPPPIMAYADGEGLIALDEDDEAPAPPKKKGKKEKPEPVVEDEDDGELESEPDADDDDGELEEPEAPAPKKSSKKPSTTMQVLHETVGEEIVEDFLTPESNELELTAGSSGKKIQVVLMQILSALAQEGTLIISYRAKGQVEALASTPVANGLDEKMKLWRNRLKAGGDLDTDKKRKKFITENEIPLRSGTLKEQTARAMAHAITRWAEMKEQGIL